HGVGVAGGGGDGEGDRRAEWVGIRRREHQPPTGLQPHERRDATLRDDGTHSRVGARCRGARTRHDRFRGGLPSNDGHHPVLTAVNHPWPEPVYRPEARGTARAASGCDSLCTPCVEILPKRGKSLITVALYAGENPMRECTKTPKH